MNTLNDYKHAENVYLTNCKADGLSSCTLRNYKDHIDNYFNFCEDNSLSPFEQETVLEWKVVLHESGLQNSTIAVYMRDVRLFFSWACASALCEIEINPVGENMIPKVKRRPYEKLMTEEEIVSTLAGDSKEGFRKSPVWSRNNAMAILFLESAMRVSELCAITLDDVDWERAVIYVRHGKGDKPRYVSFPPLAQKAVEDYLSGNIRPSALPSDAPLFGTSSEKRPDWHAFTRQQASDIIQRHMKAVTGRDDIRTHALRHASASAMLMVGLPKEQIQAVLGHSSIQTTERYIAMLRPESAAIRTSDAFSELERRTVREVV